VVLSKTQNESRLGLCQETSVAEEPVPGIRFIYGQLHFGHSQNNFICGHMLKNRFGEFHLLAHNEFFDYLIEQFENEEILELY
jgi:hypothetical protein